MIKSNKDKIKIAELAKKYNLTEAEVEAIILSPFAFIREKTKNLDLAKDLTQREFESLKTNFNIPCIGKLHASYFLYKNAKNKAALDGDIKTYFTERDKTMNMGSGKNADTRQIAEAEAEVKDMLYRESLKDVTIDPNIEPMFNTLFLTARRNRVRTDSGLLMASSLVDGNAQIDFAETQVVMAAGPQVQQALTGSEVVIDFESMRVKLSDSMAQKVKKESEIKVPIIVIDGTEFIHVSERNLKYISKKV